ncbi:membrane protein [Beggiatoa sp. PS]|nr:membrane protein [Beggiatoa sp. PS]
MTQIKYRFEDYNNYNVLKIPLTLVLTNLYLLKQIVIFVLPMISSIPLLTKFAHEHFNLALLFSSIPAILVIISMIRRAPKTRLRLIRWSWHRGRFLLLSTLFLEIGFIILYLILGITKFNEVTLIFLYLDAVLIFYLMKSQRVRDVFAEFPTLEEKKIEARKKE